MTGDILQPEPDNSTASVALILLLFPIGVIVFPGSGISQNLADEAREMGIAVWRFDSGAESALLFGNHALDGCL